MTLDIRQKLISKEMVNKRSPMTAPACNLSTPITKLSGKPQEPGGLLEWMRKRH